MGSSATQIRQGSGLGRPRTPRQIWLPQSSAAIDEGKVYFECCAMIESSTRSKRSPESSVTALKHHPFNPKMRGYKARSLSAQQKLAVWCLNSTRVRWLPGRDSDGQISPRKQCCLQERASKSCPEPLEPKLFPMSSFTTFCACRSRSRTTLCALMVFQPCFDIMRVAATLSACKTV